MERKILDEDLVNRSVTADFGVYRAWPVKIFGSDTNRGDFAGWREPGTFFNQQRIRPMETVRAKFKVENVRIVQPDEGSHTITLAPVTSGSEENERFYKWTPGGSIELGVVNQETAEFFQPGAEVYVDFSYPTPPFDNAGQPI